MRSRIGTVFQKHFNKYICLSGIRSSHWSPISLAPFSLVPQYIIGAHWSPISLIPHITGPPSHWSPFSFVTPSSANPNGPPTHWSPISFIGSPSHWSPISLIHQLAPTHHPFHWSPISLVPHPTHWSPISLVPHLIRPLLIGPPIHKSPATYIGPTFHWSIMISYHIIPYHMAWYDKAFLCWGILWIET